MPYKYGLIKVEYKGLEDNYCELVEISFEPSSKEYSSFRKARLCSIEDLKNAYEDCLDSGINYWFAKNGVFSKSDNGFWEWTRNLSDEEIELYAVYGGD